MLTDTFVNPSEHRPVVQLFVQVKQVFFREDDPQTAAGTIWTTKCLVQEPRDISNDALLSFCSRDAKRVA